MDEGFNRGHIACNGLWQPCMTSRCPAFILPTEQLCCSHRDVAGGVSMSEVLPYWAFARLDNLSHW